jgi:hypothetical protein
MWSVKALEGEHKNRVITHTRHLALMDCTFKVSEAGRQRVLRERRKNVHAGIVGTAPKSILTAIKSDYMAGDGVPITYNPYKYDSFVSKLDDTRKIKQAKIVTLFDRSVTAFAVA